jgi:hypothetical protein
VVPKNALRSAVFQHLLACNVREVMREIGKKETTNFVQEMMNKHHLPRYEKEPGETPSKVLKRNHDRFYSWLTGRRVATLDDVTTIGQAVKGATMPADWTLFPTEDEVQSVVSRVPSQQAVHPPAVAAPRILSADEQDELRGFALAAHDHEEEAEQPMPTAYATPALSPEKDAYYRWFQSEVASVATPFLRASAIELRRRYATHELWRDDPDEEDSRFRIFPQSANQVPDSQRVDGICGAWAIDVDTYLDDDWVAEVVPAWAIIDGHFIARVTQWAREGDELRPVKVIAGRVVERLPGEYQYGAAPATVLFERGRYVLRFSS